MDTRVISIIDSIYQQQPLMVTQLQEYCNVNSGTNNLDGLRLMSRALEKDFGSIADTIVSKKLPSYPNINMLGATVMQHSGAALLITKRPELSRRILLCGHMDTVYDISNIFQACTTLNSKRLNGPGVADMKGGLIVMLYALQAFEKSSAAPSLGWDVLINSDEEFGSQASHELLMQLAQNVSAALIYEPSMDDSGTLVRNRKGSAKLTIIATGKSAHAGRDFNSGRNAICYLAEILIQINKLNQERLDVSINIGLIHGGEAINIVPETAVAKLDVRINSAADESWIWQQLERITQQYKHQDYKLTIHGNFGRPAYQPNIASHKLFKQAQDAGNKLGLDLHWKDSGGCSDGNNLARTNLPILDTLGVRGGNLHSHQEYILIDSLPERTALSFLLLQNLALGGLEQLSA